MKYFKLITKILSVVLLTFFVFKTASNYYSIQKINQRYDHYYNEEANIRLRLHSKDTPIYENDFEQYKFQFLEVSEFYNYLSRYDKIQFLDVSYVLNISKKHDLVGEQRFQTLNLELSEGRNFTQEEIDSGANVVLLNSNLSRFYAAGDIYEIRYNNNPYGYSTFNAEVIGFYQNIENKDDLNLDRYLFMPNKTILNISNIWMDEMNENDPFQKISPVEILNPIVHCKNEKDYELVSEYIKEKRHRVKFNFDIIRIDQHYRSEFSFDTKEYQMKFTHYLLCSIFTFLFIISQEILFYVVHLKRQNEFKEKLIYEQEMNVQKIMSLNQETHRLKHDLRHFLNQISYYVQNEEKDQTMKLLSDYKNEFESLDIPAFTQNRIIDMVINHYLNKAKKEGYDFTYSVTHVPMFESNERKLYILFSNALENAFVHSDTKKKISLNISYIEPYYRFTIVNTILKHEPMNQKDHGYGLISMKEIVKEMNGEIRLSTKDDKYICTLLLPTTNEQE